MKKLTILLLLFFLSLPLFAQLQELKRIETEIKDKTGDDYKVFNFKEKGVLTLLDSDDVLRNMKREIIFTQYDTALNMVWQRSYVMDGLASFTHHHQDGNYFYMLVNIGNFKYEILKVDIKDGLLSYIGYEKMLDMEITHFRVVKDVIFMGGTMQSNPVVLCYDYLHNDKPKVLPSINQLKATLSRIEANETGDKVYIILSSNHPAKANLFFNTYDLEGKLLSNLAIGSEKEYFLLTYQAYMASDKEQYLFGTYSISDRENAQGIYVAHFVNNLQKGIKFYDFSYLKNFFNYLHPKRKEKVISKINKKRDEGKIQKHTYNLFVRDLMFQDGKIIMLAESYVPVYSENQGGLASVQPAGYGMWNTSHHMYYNQMSDMHMKRNRKNPPLSYKYRHAIVCAFDKNGKLLWDNSFEFKDVESSTPIPFLEVSVKDDHLTMLHFYDKKFFFKNTYRSDAAEIAQEDSLAGDGRQPNELVIERTGEALLQWYEDNYLLYGVQQIRTRDQFGKYRKVFYLAKLHHAIAAENKKR